MHGWPYAGIDTALPNPVLRELSQSSAHQAFVGLVCQSSDSSTPYPSTSVVVQSPRTGSGPRNGYCRETGMDRWKSRMIVPASSCSRMRAGESRDVTLRDSGPRLMIQL